jgi:hypothetical protein
MRHHVSGRRARQLDGERPLGGLFLVRVEWISYRRHPHRPFLVVRFVILEPKSFERCSFSGRLYSTERALWELNWFLRDFGYDPDLLRQDEVDEKALVNLRGVVRTSYITLDGRNFQNLEAFASAADWEELSWSELEEVDDAQEKARDL